MREHRLTLPQLVALVATRGLAGFGAGLLLASKIGKKRRKLVGGAMLAAGALSTIPLAIMVFRRGAEDRPNGMRRHATASAHA